MDILLENWLEETIEEGDTLAEVPKVSLRAMFYAAIANYRAPAWIQAPKKQL